MSLKAFHVLFVAVSLLLACGFGAWCIQKYRTSGDQAALAVGVLSLVIGGMSIVYGRWFLRKVKGYSNL